MIFFDESARLTDEQWKYLLGEIRKTGPIAELMDLVRANRADPPDDDEADTPIYCPVRWEDDGNGMQIAVTDLTRDILERRLPKP